MQSKITSGKTTPLFSLKILGKYSIQYFQCEETGFVQTETPYWLDEAYSDAISDLDIGLVSRNIATSQKTALIIANNFNRNGSFIDYGGGYGLFVRLMRDKGYDFSRYDPLCKNIFSKKHDFNTLEQASSAELLTAWEVFEHLPDPRESLNAMLQAADNVLFSTELIPKGVSKPFKEWWYLLPETGQHVSFYTPQAMAYLAKLFSVHFYSNGSNMHIFCKSPLRRNPFGWNLRRLCATFANRLLAVSLNKPSLLSSDFDQLRM